MNTRLTLLPLLLALLFCAPGLWPAAAHASDRRLAADVDEDDDEDEDDATSSPDDDSFEPENRRFAPGTAYTLPAGSFEVGVFGPLRYGLTDTIELSAHPVWCFAWPGVTAKKQLYHGGRLTVASSHSLEIPTPFLRLIQVEGTGGLIPTDNDIPWFLMTDERVIVTVEASPGHDVTWFLGFTLAGHLGDKRLDTIDYPLAYPRLSALHNLFTVRTGLDLDGRITGDFHYAVDFDLFVLPEDETRLAFEHSAGLIWRPSRTWQVFAGYKFAWSQLPFGSEQVWLPLLDVSWAF